MLVVCDLVESHLHHLQQIVLPVFHAHVLAHAESLQLVVLVAHHVRRVDATEDFDALSEVDVLMGTHHGTECFLCQNRAVESTGRIGTDIAMTAVFFGGLTEIVEQDATAAHPRFSVLFHALELFEVDITLTAILGEIPQLDDVRHGVEEYRVGRCAISSGTPYLLVEALDALRHVVVDDPSHVALVDAHSEGDGGANHLNLVHLEALLHRSPFLVGKSGVVGSGIDALLLQFLGHHLRVLPRQAVDDARIARSLGDKLEDVLQFLLLGALPSHRQAEVGTVETAHERLAREMKLMDDVFSGDFVGSGSERHHRYAIELLMEESELGIFRTEIMSPLTDAVSLIDGEKGNLDVAE